MPAMTPSTADSVPQIFSFDMPHDVDRLWSLLTDLEAMKSWYFDIVPEFQAQVGFQTEFVITNEGRTFTHQWKVTEVISGSRLSYEWTFAEYPGRSTSIFEIAPADDGTSKLTLTNVINENFPSDIPEFSLESSAGGWNWFMDRLAKV